MAGLRAHCTTEGAGFGQQLAGSISDIGTLCCFQVLDFDRLLIGVAKAGVAQPFEPFENQIADCRCVVDAAKVPDVAALLLALRFVGVDPAPATSRSDPEVRDPEESLDRTLPDRHLLDVGKGEGHFADLSNAFADPKAAVGNDIPPHFPIEDYRHEGQRKLDQEADHTDDLEPSQDPQDDCPVRNVGQNFELAGPDEVDRDEGCD